MKGKRELSSQLTRDALAMELEARVMTQKRKARRKKRAQQAAEARTGLSPRLLEAYRAAGLRTGLGRKGLWSLSQRNKAKALAKIEPEPDIHQLHLFVP
jgi:hypothetical protein